MLWGKPFHCWTWKIVQFVKLLSLDYYYYYLPYLEAVAVLEICVLSEVDGLKMPFYWWEILAQNGVELYLKVNLNQYSLLLILSFPICKRQSQEKSFKWCAKSSSPPLYKKLPKGLPILSKSPSLHCTKDNFKTTWSMKDKHKKEKIN